MTERLTSAIVVNMLIRLAEQTGGVGTVVAKGDPGAGAISILIAERGKPVQILERLLQADGSYHWDSPIAAGKDSHELAEFLARRRQFDPDAWIVELDTASSERFAEEIRALD